MVYETDQGTLQLIQQLTPDAAIRLQHHISKKIQKYDHIKFQSADFVGRTDIKEVRLEMHESKSDVLVATVNMKEGIVWRRGSLRIPGIVLPEIVRISAKGKLIEEIVEGAPFTGFTVTSLIQDGSGDTGKLRIRCTAEKTGPIVINPNNAQTHNSNDLADALMAYQEINIDPVAEKAFRIIGRDKTFSVLLNLINGRPQHQEVLDITYFDLLEEPIPAQFGISGKTRSGGIRIIKVKAGIRAVTMINIPGYKVSFAFDKSTAHFNPNQDPPGSVSSQESTDFISRAFSKLTSKIAPPPPKPVRFRETRKNVLGFEAPNSRIVRTRENGDWGMTAFVMENECTIGSLVTELR